MDNSKKILALEKRLERQYELREKLANKIAKYDIRIRDIREKIKRLLQTT